MGATIDCGTLTGDGIATAAPARGIAMRPVADTTSNPIVMRQTKERPFILESLQRFIKLLLSSEKSTVRVERGGSRWNAIWTAAHEWGGGLGVLTMGIPRALPSGSLPPRPPPWEQGGRGRRRGCPARPSSVQRAK